MKKLYKCDICNEQIERPDLELYGIRFSNMKDFTIGGYGSTDGTHICIRCASQLRKHLNSEAIGHQLDEYSKQGE